MRILGSLFVILTLCSCGKSDVPKDQFERNMLDAVLREAKQQEVSVPSPYSFRIFETKVIFEMQGTEKVWMVELFRKGDTNHPVIQAEVNPTNFHITAFSEEK